MTNNLPESETKHYLEKIAVQLESFPSISPVSKIQLQELLMHIKRALKINQFGYLELKYINQMIEQLIVETTLESQKIFE